MKRFRYIVIAILLVVIASLVYLMDRAPSRDIEADAEFDAAADAAEKLEVYRQLESSEFENPEAFSAPAYDGATAEFDSHGTVSAPAYESPRTETRALMRRPAAMMEEVGSAREASPSPTEPRSPGPPGGTPGYDDEDGSPGPVGGTPGFE